MNTYPLEVVDEIRIRAKVGYELAKEALDASGGDLLDALVYLERKGDIGQASPIERLKNAIDAGFVSQIQVIRGDEILFDIPLVVGAVIATKWALPFSAALLAAIATDCEIRIVQRDGTDFKITELTAEKLGQLKSLIKSKLPCCQGKSCEGEMDGEFEEERVL